jgi:hypothetical protein
MILADVHSDFLVWSGLPLSPLTLPPFTGHDFELSTPQSLDVAAYQTSRLRVRTGSNKQFKRKIACLTAITQ